MSETQSKQKSKAKKQPPKQGQEVPKQPAAGGEADPKIALFPIKPARKAKAPGNPVILITNLFKISLTAKKPIYRYGLTIEYVDEGKPRPDAGDAKSGPKAAGPRKIASVHRKAAVKKAIEKWIATTRPSDYPPKNISYPYVLDSNGSTMFALFNMFKNAPRGPKDSLDFEVEVPVPVRDQDENRKFVVKFHDGQLLNIQDFMDFCTTKSNATIREISQFSRALNTILHAKISTMDQFVLIQSKTAGQSTVFPFDKKKQFPIGPGIMCNMGYSLSSRPTETGIVLNVANTVAPFYEKSDLLTLLKNRYRVQNFNETLMPHVIEDLKRELKNKQVEVIHIKYGSNYKKHRVHDIGGSAMDKFTLVDKATKSTREVTIAEYFKKEYPKHALKHPKLPCIIDNGRKLPLELCTLVEKQRVNRKLDPDETAAVIRSAALPPEKHFDNVRENVRQVVQHKQPFNDFGLDINPVPIEVEGRELPPFPLIGGSKKGIIPSNGQYMANDRFLKPAVLNKFCVAILVDSFILRDWRNNPDELRARTSAEFVNWFIQSGSKDKGVKINIQPQAVPVDLIPGRNGTIDQMREPELKDMLLNYMRHLNKNKFDQAIIVLPKRCPDWLYGYLQYLETTGPYERQAKESWTRTSCIKYENLNGKILNSRDRGRMFISNLWLKYNTKLGGVNFALKPDPSKPFLGDGVLYLSVDVCHPAPGDKLPQSVAAVVGMWDITSENMSFCTRIRAQRKMRSEKDQSTVEEVLDIDVMVSDVLESYRAKKNRLPGIIIILRDGVSEGQFEMVSKFELTKVKRALKNKYQLSKCPEPRLSCLVVQKRHKVRFMRKQPVKFETKFGTKTDFNIQPGTVVDSQITRPNEFSFYLAPHKALQGTARAPYIYIIYDEIGLSQDAAQAMILALSYLSPRCTKSTSIPTPVNLADLAAERGKNIVVSWNAAHRVGPKGLNEASFNELNRHLAGLADENYKNTLYYV